MGLKDQLENNPTLIILGVLLAGFVSGVGAMTFLEEREKALKEEIIKELKQQNTALKQSNSSLSQTNAELAENNQELDKAIRRVLVDYVNVEAIAKGKPLGGENSVVPEVRKEILRADRGEISNISRDPSSWVNNRLGL
jgi:mannitol-specific phosphotransferase system IIBC component